jgi:hypothetical protein
MHDLGSTFPDAAGRVEENDEYMLVEESGNMILMAYVGNSRYIQKHYNLLKQFDQYLIEFSLILGIQLSIGKPTITLTHLCTHAHYTIDDLTGRLTD